MSTGVVLAIHSKHAEKIYSGVKRYEYRTQKPLKEIDYIALYETGDVRAITGFAKIAAILEDTPTRVWELTKSFAGISRAFFRDYFDGKKKAVAYCIGEVTSFEKPLSLSEVGVHHAPQSFQYIDSSEVRKLLEAEMDHKKPLLPRFFVGGIHGTGKSLFVNDISYDMGLPSYTASNIISEKAALRIEKEVLSHEIETNQDLLIQGLRRTRWFVDGGLLDGHFILKNGAASYSRVPCETFAKLDLDAMLVLTASPKTIAKRLNERDGIDWNISLLREMQDLEISYAREISKSLRIPLSIIR